MRFLDAGGVGSGDNQLDVSRALGESAVASKQGDGDHAAPARLFDGRKDVPRFTRARYTDEHIPLLPEAVHLTGESIDEVVIVADGREQTSIHPEGHGRIRTAVADEAADEFGCDVRGIGCAAAVTAEHELAARGECGDHRIGGAQQGSLEGVECGECFARRSERAAEMR